MYGVSWHRCSNLKLTLDERGADWVPWIVLLTMIGIPLAAILIDSFIRRKDLTVITSVYFGLLIGVFLTYVAVLALSPLLASFSSSPILPWLLYSGHASLLRFDQCAHADTK